MPGKHLMRILMLSVFFVFFKESAQAQLCDPNFDPWGCPPDPVPLDGGVSVLVAAGLAYGLKKIKSNLKE